MPLCWLYLILYEEVLNIDVCIIIKVYRECGDDYGPMVMYYSTCFVFEQTDLCIYMCVAFVISDGGSEYQGLLMEQSKTARTIDKNITTNISVRVKYHYVRKLEKNILFNDHHTILMQKYLKFEFL